MMMIIMMLNHKKWSFFGVALRASHCRSCCCCSSTMIIRSMKWYTIWLNVFQCTNNVHFCSDEVKLERNKVCVCERERKEEQNGSAKVSVSFVMCHSIQSVIYLYNWLNKFNRTNNRLICPLINNNKRIPKGSKQWKIWVDIDRFEKVNYIYFI